MSKFLKVAQVAEILATSKPTVLKLIKEGKIPSIKIGRDYRIPLDEFEAWINKN